MKALILLATIVTLVFSGSITKVGEISLRYPTSGYTTALHFYMKFETALVAGDVVRIGFPDKFKRWGSWGEFKIRQMSNDYTATSTDSLYTEAGARMFYEDTGATAVY